MNDEEIREKCKKMAHESIEKIFNLWGEYPKGWQFNMLDQDDAESIKTAALLYIAANMPSPDESDEKPCEYCDPEKPNIFNYPCGAVSHYLYINSKQKKLADVYDGTEDNWIAIKYCPFCRRKL